MHPLAKVLKRNCNALYDRQGIGGKRLTSAIGAFLVRKGPTLSEVVYYKEPEIGNLVAELSKTAS